MSEVSCLVQSQLIYSNTRAISRFVPVHLTRKDSHASQAPEIGPARTGFTFCACQLIDAAVTAGLTFAGTVVRCVLAISDTTYLLRFHPSILLQRQLVES
jgi:hypothetical protein